MQELYAIIPMLVSAAIALLMKDREEKIRYVALAMAALSLILSIFVLIQPQAINLTWFNIGSLSFELQTTPAATNVLLLFIVNIVNVLIMGYSFGFMDKPSEQPRYYFLMPLFAASMMLFAVSASFVTTLFAWEGLGITSYLLIGFWYWKPEASAAARKSITVIIIGDAAFIAAIAIIALHYNTLSMPVFLSQTNSSVLILPLLLILVAAFTKSAQLPFSEWLPDAMEGPTPVSAFLHSSTMVKAGIFLVVLLFPAFQTAHLLWVILLVGIATTVYGAVNAFTERHVKRILAYSTIEEMGLMFVALGLGSVFAALLLFVIQTFYKVLLFMLAGMAMKANSGEEDISKIYGFATSKAALIALAIGTIALAGVFPPAGFLGKLSLAVPSFGLPIYIILIAVQLISSLYIFRWAVLIMRKPKGQDRAKISIEYKTMPMGMIAAISAAAALVLLSALAYVYLPLSVGPIGFNPSAFDIIVENIVAIAALALIYVTYKKGMLSVWKGKFRGAYLGAALNAIYWAFAYLAHAISFAAHGAELALNRIVAYTVGTVSLVGKLISKLENGKVNTYMVAFLVGIIIIIIIFVL